MSDRKETPDVLGDILNAQPTTSAPAPAVATPTHRPVAKPKQQPRRKSAGRTTKSTGTAWEYKEVIFREFRGWRPRFVDGEELDNWREQPEIRDYLAVLGADGWEMVGIMENKRNTRSIYFKRTQR